MYCSRTSVFFIILIFHHFFQISACLPDSTLPYNGVRYKYTSNTENTGDTSDINRVVAPSSLEMNCDLYFLLGFPLLDLKNGQMVTDVKGNSYTVRENNIVF